MIELMLLLSKQPNMTCLQLKEVVEVVEESTQLSQKEKKNLLERISIPSECIKS
jgi:hypothetical protein|tara:strand:- start:22 stop:183 length:162 start_codon:yes stop_codon:yes gene_type:complete